MKKLLALSAAMIVAGSVQATTIDAFDGTGPFDLNAPQTNTAVGNSSTGFARSLTSSTSGTSTNVQIDTATNSGLYAHSQTAGVTGVSELEYALGGLDLTEGGTMNAFRILLDSVDLNGVIGIEADGVLQSLSTNTIIADNGFALPSFADFLFSSFAGVDFTNVASVSLRIDGSNQVALDASIDSFGTVCSALTSNGGSGADPAPGECRTPPVPEPVTLGLLGLGLLGLGGLRRRKAG